MRTRRTLMLAMVVILAFLPMAVAPVVAAAGQAVLAQEGPDAPGDPVDDTDAQQQGEEAQDEGAGQQDPDAQTGAGEGAEEGTAEEGPVWTYQMARLGIVLTLLLLAAVGFTYWRFVVHPQRRGT